MKHTYLVLIGLTINFPALSAVKTLEQVIEQRLTHASEYTEDLTTVASRDRIRAWLPTAPLVSYSSNDNHSWKAYAVSTTLPIPFKSLYRDDVEKAKSKYQQAQAIETKQDLLRETIESFLDCSIPSEMALLMEVALGDQKVVSSISNSLYSAGSVPQADRVAAELLARSLEAQVRMQKDQAYNGCRRWERWADASNTEPDQIYLVPENISNTLLENLQLRVDHHRDVMEKNLIRLNLEKNKLWSKFVPDLNVTVYKNNYFNLIQSGGPPVKNTTSWSVGITLPFTFPFYDNTEYREERAQLGLSSMRAELERNDAEKKWTEARNDWVRATSRLNEIWTKDMALSEVLVESSLASYRSGKVGFADLVLARRTKIDLKVEELQLKAQRLIAKSICLTQCDE
jgi:outer membrane protein TolC